MKSIIPTYLIIIGFALVTLVASSLIAYQMQITAAQNYHTNCVNRIQASYFNEDVIEECIDAAPDEYSITVTPTTIYEDRKEYLVVLEYDAHLPFLNVDVSDVQIEGFAR